MSNVAPRPLSRNPAFYRHPAFYSSPAPRGHIDPRRTFLARAAARLTLVEVGEMSLDEAVSDLVPDLEGGFEQLVELLAATRSPPRPREPRLTFATTIEAIMLCVRERGVDALKESANRDRLSRCDATAWQQIDDRIAALVSKRAS